MSERPEDTDQQTRDLQRCLDRLGKMAPVYEERANYYTGANSEVMVSHPRLAKLIAKYTEGGHFGLPYVAVPVDALMDRVDLSGLTVADDSTSTDRLKEALWEPNNLEDEADDAHTRAGYLGDYYAVLSPKDDDERELDLQFKHPLNAVIVYRTDDDRTPHAGWYQWRAGDHWEGQLVYDDAIVHYRSEESATPPDKAVKWEVVTDEETGDEDVEEVEPTVGFVMHHFRPDSVPYGTPVNARGYGAQDAITKLNATDMAVVDRVGFPMRYALLDPDAAEGDDISDDFNDAGTLNAPVETPESSTITDGDGTTSKIKDDPGAIVLLRGVKSVGEFGAAQGSPFQDREEFQIRSMAVLTRTPLYEFMPETADAPSGESRRRADASIVKHAKKVMGTYGRTWSRIGEQALAFLNLGTDKRVVPTWQPAEVSTDKEGIELVAAKVLNGIPLDVALTEAGYTEEQVAEWLPEEGDGVPTSIAMLKELAPALQALGQAITGGAASEEDVRKLGVTWLTGAAPEPKPLVIGTDPAAQVPTGELGPDGQPVTAPPKGVVPPQLASTVLPPAGN